MAHYRNSKRGKRKITLALVSFLSLFSLFTSTSITLAWFITYRHIDLSIDGMVAKSLNAEIVGISLYKFDFPIIEIGGAPFIDYLSPENGEVNNYPYNTTERKFGKTSDGVFEPCEVMNVYDPLEIIISGTDVYSMNCNAIYEIDMRVEGTASIDLLATSNLFAKTIDSDAIAASDCMDFTLFTEEDLSSPSLMEGETKKYYPSYLEQSYSMDEEEEIYYKLSYLASIRSSENFYDDGTDSITLGRKSISPDGENRFKVYVNVNYSSSQLEEYALTLKYDTISVIFDYYFVFEISRGNREESV